MTDQSAFFIVILRITIPKIIMTVADSEKTITKDLRIRFAIYKASFFCQYNYCPEIRELYQRPGILIEGITRINNIAQRYEGGKQYSELLISNYDTSERMKSYFQFSLFDREIDVDKILSEKIIYRGG